MRQKSTHDNYRNVYVTDGFLSSIPLPDSSLDVLFTSNAIGWNIEKELHEIERVVNPGGQAIHIMRMNEKVEGNIQENLLHKKLISSEWKYDCQESGSGNEIKLKYSKTIN
jgi:ubiquinone/menaquinone biosynthesis C-methylase UbiE